MTNPQHEDGAATEAVRSPAKNSEWQPWATAKDFKAKALQLEQLWLFASYVDNWNNWRNGGQTYKPKIAEFEAQLGTSKGGLAKARQHVERASRSYIMDLELAGSGGKGKASIAESRRAAYRTAKLWAKQQQDTNPLSEESEEPQQENSRRRRGGKPRTNGDVRQAGQLWAHIGRCIYELIEAAHRAQYVPEFIDFLELWGKEVRGITDPVVLKRFMNEKAQGFSRYWEGEGEPPGSEYLDGRSDEELAELQRAEELWEAQLTWYYEDAHPEGELSEYDQAQSYESDAERAARRSLREDDPIVMEDEFFDSGLK